MRQGIRGLVALGGAVIFAALALQLQGAARADDLVRQPAAPSGLGWPCSVFSEEQKTVGGVDWSYRVCGSGGPWSEIDFRFRNEGSRPVVIGFQAWLERPRTCDDAAGPESGRAALAAGETTPWAGHLYRVRTADFGGRLWLCAREVQDLS